MRIGLKRCIANLLIMIQVIFIIPTNIKADDVGDLMLYEIPMQMSNNLGEVSNITAMEQDGYILVDFEEICELIDVEHSGSFLTANSPQKEDLNPLIYSDSIPQIHDKKEINIFLLGGYRQYYNHYGYYPNLNIKKLYEAAFDIDIDKCTEI